MLSCSYQQIFLRHPVFVERHTKDVPSRRFGAVALPSPSNPKNDEWVLVLVVVFQIHQLDSMSLFVQSLLDEVEWLEVECHEIDEQQRQPRAHPHLKATPTAILPAHHRTSSTTRQRRNLLATSARLLLDDHHFGLTSIIDGTLGLRLGYGWATVGLVSCIG